MWAALVRRIERPARLKAQLVSASRAWADARCAFFYCPRAAVRGTRVPGMVSRLEISMAPEQKQRRMEWLRSRLGVLRSRIAILPQVAQAEFQPLVDNIEAHLEQAGRQPDGVRRLIDEFRAIDKCVRFEMAVSLRDVPPSAAEDCSGSQPHRRLDLSKTFDRHFHLSRPDTEASSRNA
jgi:hypothetical protein